MSKLLSLLLLSTALFTSPAMARDYFGKDSNADNNYRKYEPESTTLRGSRSDTYSRSYSDSYSNTSRESNRQSEGYRGSYRSGNQINDNGLVINRE